MAAGGGITGQVSERHDRASKVSRKLAEGELVRVACAANQTEGEFIQGLLLEEGVPSLLRRTAGFDVPDMLAAGPRDVMVPAAGVATARDVLLQAELGHAVAARVSGADVSVAPAPARLLAWLVGGVAAVVLVIALLSLVAH